MAAPAKVGNRLVGSPVERVEDLRFLRGKGNYVDDTSLPNQLYAAILRSSVPHGRIRGIDKSAALKMPGVHAVIAAADIGKDVPVIPIRLQPLPEVFPLRQPVIAVDRVRYVGEPVAIVIADTPGLAEDALEYVEVNIEPLPTVASRKASSTDKSLLFPDYKTNLAKKFTGLKGDADAAFKGAHYIKKQRLAVQRHMALPMEPRGLLADWRKDEKRLTVYGAGKVLFFNRRAVAQMLGLDEASVELVENDIGGGFGARGEFYPEDFLIPFASYFLGRPVKWNEDRRENLSAMNHAREMEAEYEIACDTDGTIRGIRGHVDVDNGAYVRSNGLTPPRNVAQFTTGPYRIPNIHIDVSVRLTNKTPCGTYRAPGRFEGSFFIERMIEIAARDLGIDPIEMRRKNLVSLHEMPYPMASMQHIDPYTDTECDSGDFHITFERCLKEFGWDEKVKLQGKKIDGRYHGVSAGCFIEGGAAGPRESARLKLEADGTISVFVGSSALGQGLETVMGQITADALNVPFERVRVFHGSTSYVREGFGSYHSRSTVMGGSAILLASEPFKDKLRKAAAKRLEVPEQQITLIDERAVSSGGASVDWKELAADDISAEESFTNTKHTYAYGAHCCHVAVDPGTGHVQVLDYVTVEDVGKIINPLTLHGQVVGAVVQGLGSTFMEHLIYNEDGQLLTGSLADYVVPLADDYPAIRGVTLDDYPSPNNPLGAKGAGEGGIIAVGGVASNAVENALSFFKVEIEELPLTPPAVWTLIERRRAAESASN
ncbi:MAG: xanthine dehydrogenase family protein molybdopterin-binding subunit [Xanthobacteraceae bacterium]|nr:xanthine dehydrogenase family protein molybdopterin-binding subunit [Xanthobacteraceae bacterium]